MWFVLEPIQRAKMKAEMDTECIELSPLAEISKLQFYRSIFNKYDKNRSGRIELNELRELIGHDEEVPKELVKKIFNAADQNKDSQIDFDEFLIMMQQRDYRELFQKYINIYIRYVLPKPCHKYSSEVMTDGIDGVYEKSYTCCPPPIAMVLISAFEMACFITDEITQKESSLDGSGITAKVLIYDPYHREEVWRYFTYMFVHIGYMHLVMNLFVQLALGVPLEMVHRWWRVLTVYFAGVIAGSLGSSVADPGVYLAGASGGVYAIITAHIAAIILNWNDMSMPLVQLLFFVVLTSVDIGSAIYNRYWLETIQNVSYSAHLAGAISGLLVGIWVLKNFNTTRKEECLWWGAVIVYAMCMGALVVVNLAWTDHFLKG